MPTSASRSSIRTNEGDRSGNGNRLGPVSADWSLPRFASIAMALVFPALLVTTPAAATTVVNGDAKARTVSIAETNKPERQETIPPSGSIKDVCLEGCQITLMGEQDATYVLEGKEQVTIEGGRLYWDGTLEDLANPKLRPFRVGPDGRRRAPARPQ